MQLVVPRAVSKSMAQNYKKDFNGQNIFVGIDVHLKTWSVSIALPSGYLKTHTQKASAKELFEHLNKNYPNGIYHAVYESGFSGFSTYYAFKELGIDCMVVYAADVPTTQKEKVTKSDPVDSRRLARSLMNGELEGIYVHSKESLDDRGLIRHRTMLLKLIGGTKRGLNICFTTTVSPILMSLLKTTGTGTGVSSVGCSMMYNCFQRPASRSTC